MGKKILVIAPQWIGDAVASSALLQLLAQRYPYPIEMMAGGHVAAVYQFMPEIAHIHVVNFVHGALQLSARYLESKKYKNDYASAWILPNSFKSVLIPWLARIPIRVGYANEARVFLLTHPLIKPLAARRPLMTQYYANLLQALGEEIPDLLPTCSLQVDKAQQQEVLSMFKLDPYKVVLCPGAEYGTAKQWPLEHWITLSQALLQQGYDLLILGSNKESGLAAQIESAVTSKKGLINLCGKTNLSQAIMLLASAQLVISNDSGLMHIAAALKRPTLGIFGSSDPRHTPPAGIINQHFVQTLWLALECSPCFKRECPLQHRNCLHNISPATVLKKLETLGRDQSMS